MASNVSYMSANRYWCAGVLLLLLLLSLLLLPLLRARLLLVLLRAQSPFSSAAFRQHVASSSDSSGPDSPGEPATAASGRHRRTCVHTRTEANLDACVCVCVVPNMIVTTTAQGGYRVAPRTPSQVSSVRPQEYSTSSK